MRAPCKIDGCERESRGRGWCGTHWLRWRKYGDPLAVKVNGVDFNVKAACTVDDCDRKAHAHGYCNKHLQRWQKHGDPSIVGERNGRPLKGLVPTWTAVHKRLSRTRGAARLYACVDCGSQAAEWSYDGHDEDELVGRSGDIDVKYSLDPSHYEARCISCHRRFDGAGNRPRSELGQFLPRAEITVRGVSA